MSMTDVAVCGLCSNWSSINGGVCSLEKPGSHRRYSSDKPRHCPFSAFDERPYTKTRAVGGAPHKNVVELRLAAKDKR